MLVRFRPGAAAANVQRALDETGGRIAGELAAIGWKIVALPRGRSVDDALARLRRDPHVDAAEPDRIVHAAAVPNDTQYPGQWALDRIKAKLAWSGNVAGAD